MRRGIRVVVVMALAAGVVAGPRADAAPTMAEVLGFVVRTVGFDASDGIGARLADGTLLPGWQATVEGEADAVMLSWEGDAGGEVMLRRHGPQGPGPWVEVAAAPEEAPDAGGEGSPVARAVAGPVWTGSGTGAVELRVVEGELENLEAELLRAVPVLTDVGELVEAVVQDPAGAVGELVEGLAGPEGGPAPAPSAPVILAPAAWGSPGFDAGAPGCEAGPRVAPLELAVVHHTVLANDYSADEVPAMIRSMYYAHLARGFCDIGYNVVVDAFGRTWQARSGPVGQAVIGGHASGFNTGSVGVALLGQFQPGASPPAAAPTPAALSAVADYAAWQFRLHGIDPASTATVVAGDGSPRHPEGATLALPRVVGHRDVGATACPGDYVYDRLDEIRADVVQR